MSPQQRYEEEIRKLQETLTEIEQQRSRIAPVYHGDDFVEQVLEAHREDTRQRLATLAAEPYFGRLDFQEQGQDEPTALYIGKRGMDDSSTHQPRIIDWRAPVASLFYAFTGGDESVSFEAPEGTIHGEIYRKRNLSIRDRELERVVDAYVRGEENLGVSDEFLLYRLGEKKDNKLRDIVSTIQAEQDRIIRAPRGQALVIQGAAGSGKTTVALHRLAYLLYRYQEQISAERMMIFAPNTMFLDYISGVLPELGVGHVQQSTFSDWALDQLDDNCKLAPGSAESAQWFALAGARPHISEETSGRFKGSLHFQQMLNESMQRYEANFLPELPFEPWPGKSLSPEEIRQWFKVEYRHYALAQRKDRLAARIVRWLEIELKEIADPKQRKERSKLGKQRLKAFLSKLPPTDALAFYRQVISETAGHGLSKQAADATLRLLKNHSVLQEDLAPLLWIHHSFNGRSGLRFDHVVIDEAQDASPLQVAVLRACMHEPSFTLLGDLAQGIHAYRGIHRWDELHAIFTPEERDYLTLRLSYRSTFEIIAFANRILPHTATDLPPAEPVFRSGEPVALKYAANEQEQLNLIAAFIDESTAQGMRTIAIIGRTDAECARLHESLARRSLQLHLIAEDQRSYAGGVTIVPAHLAKGLEFDAVLLADASVHNYARDPQDAKLLYVACTRALHRLTLLSQIGKLSPLCE